MKNTIKVKITPAIARRSELYLDSSGCLLATACGHLGKDLFAGYHTINIDGTRYSISTRNADRISAAYGRNGQRDVPKVKKSFTVILTPCP